MPLIWKIGQAHTVSALQANQSSPRSLISNWGKRLLFNKSSIFFPQLAPYFQIWKIFGRLNHNQLVDSISTIKTSAFPSRKQIDMPTFFASWYLFALENYANNFQISRLPSGLFYSTQVLHKKKRWKQTHLAFTQHRFPLFFFETTLTMPKPEIFSSAWIIFVGTAD